jgi:CheY-like chemotaxis protein
MAKLVVLTKSLNGLSHELGENWITIGRADGNAFQIAEPSVSGRHCEVRLRGDELAVRDLLSTNGTFVAGKKIVEGVLQPGQALRVGEVELHFETASDSPGTSFKRKMLVTNTAAPTKNSSQDPIATAPVPKAKPEPEIKSGNAPETAEPTKKHQVLFVDDSLAFLETFGELCSALSNGTWKIYSAPTADRALAVLQEKAIDLVVLDIGMPMVDGLQLLGIVSRRYPGIKIAVMTGSATAGKRADALSSGAELFIEKPVSPDGIKVIFNMLNDLVSWSHREGFSGALRQVGLQELVQMECIARHSSILEIRNSKMRGQIYIEAGAITHAATGDLTGEKAFNRLLSLGGGEFQLKPFQTPPQRTIHGQWETVLMEAARSFDEETSMISKKSVEDAGNPATTENAPARETEHAALGEDIVVVATYDGEWKPLNDPKK